MPEVSVVLPTHDRPRALVRAAGSVLDQDVRDLELIVVDDASREPASRVLDRAGDPRLRILRTGDAAVGPSAARNAGVDAASGRWVAFQDDDDEWLPGKLRAQLERAERTGAALVYAPFLRVDAGGRPRPGARRGPEGDVLDELLRGNFVGLPTVLVRRERLAEAGPFDPDLACFEDWELMLRLAARGVRFARVDAPLVLAHDTPGSVNQASSAVQADAYAHILARHRAAIEARPDVLAEFLFHVGHHLCLAGATAAGRARLVEAVRRRPSARRVGALAASLFGTGTYAALARALGR